MGDYLSMKLKTKLLSTAVAVSLGVISSQAIASDYKKDPCAGLPSHYELTKALKASVAPTGGVDTNGGFDLNMWATVVNRDGVVCAVTFSGKDRGSQWPGSRVISAQKANTANSFSLDGLALSTANLFSAVQPGGSLFGLQFSNPVDPSVAYGADGSPKQEGAAAKLYGTRKDPFTDKRTFHGGIDLAANKGTRVFAAREGKVIFAGWKRAYGKLVVIKHDLGYSTFYGHLSRISVSFLEIGYLLTPHCGYSQRRQANGRYSEHTTHPPVLFL